MTIAETYRESLKSGQVESAAVKLLLAHVLQIEVGELFLHFQREMENNESYQSMLSRLIDGEPVQYITGTASFYGRDFIVDSSVLIPRPETEIMVDEVKKWLANHPAQTIIDLGTGSGCLAVSIKKMFPHLYVAASDISQTALEIARINARKHQVDIDLIQGNWLTPFIEKRVIADVIMSNPPYIASPSTVAFNVLEYEPHSALFAKDGIANHVEIMTQASACLKKGGLLILEIDEEQPDLLAPIAQETFKGAKIEFIEDLQGKPRFLKVETI
jgi:release factor glutamine methyltransferase